MRGTWKLTDKGKNSVKKMLTKCSIPAPYLLSGTVFRPLDEQSSQFSTILVAYLFGSGISEGREIIFKIYCVICGLRKVETLLDLDMFSTPSGETIKSLLCVVIRVTNVKDYTSNKTTWNLSPRL